LSYTQEAEGLGEDGDEADGERVVLALAVV
jgi:hypothetical protein